MPLTELQLAKAAFEACNASRADRFSNRPCILEDRHLEQEIRKAGPALSAEEVASYVKEAREKLLEHGYLTPHRLMGEVMVGWTAEKRSFGSDSAPWKGWTLIP